MSAWVPGTMYQLGHEEVLPNGGRIVLDQRFVCDKPGDMMGYGRFEMWAQFAPDGRYLGWNWGYDDCKARVAAL